MSDRFTINDKTISRLNWIGVRPARNLGMVELDRAEVRIGRGLVGDRYGKVAPKSGVNNGKREVTLITMEAIQIIAAHLRVIDGRDLYPYTRRNLVVEGVDLVEFIGKRFSIGEVEFEGTGECEPCVRMNLALGRGGFAAMRGLGGLTARVIQPGYLRIGETVAQKL